MRITIKQAKQYLLNNKNIELFSATRFLNVKIDKKLSLSECVVGINGPVIYIIYKKLTGFEHYAFKKEIEFTREFQSYTPINFFLNQKTIQIQLKKILLTLSDPIEGELNNLIKSIDFHNQLNMNEKNLKILKNTYILKKTLHYSKYVALLVGVPIAGNITYDLLLDYITDQIKEAASTAVVENADTIASKTADSLFDKFNPFS